MTLRYVDSLNNEVNWKLNQNTLKGDDLKAETTRAQLALPTLDVHEAPRKITEEEREFKAYRTLRDEWANARHEGARKARAAKVRVNSLHLSNHFTDSRLFLQKAEEDAAKKK